MCLKNIIHHRSYVGVSIAHFYHSDELSYSSKSAKFTDVWYSNTPTMICHKYVVNIVANITLNAFRHMLIVKYDIKLKWFNVTTKL